MFCVHPVESTQEGPHDRLSEALEKHLRHPFRRMAAAHTRQAFADFLQQRDGRPLILDAGCGLGESSSHLAQRYPEYQVVGVDRSAERLQRQIPRNQQAILVRADLVDWWLLAAEHKLRFAKLYLLYPNPYPKAEQFKRRWPGHPIFPWILASAEQIELRSNWLIYLQEWAQCFAQATASPYQAPETWLADPPITAFERKYARAGQRLYRWRSKTFDFIPPTGCQR